MDIKAAIAQLMQAKDLSGESMIEVMRAIMVGFCIFLDRFC